MTPTIEFDPRVTNAIKVHTRTPAHILQAFLELYENGYTYTQISEKIDASYNACKVYRVWLGLDARPLGYGAKHAPTGYVLRTSAIRVTPLVLRKAQLRAKYAGESFVQYLSGLVEKDVAPPP